MLLISVVVSTYWFGIGFIGEAPHKAHFRESCGTLNKINSSLWIGRKPPGTLASAMMNGFAPSWKVYGNPAPAYTPVRYVAVVASSVKPLYGTVVKYGNDVTSGILAMTPFAPFAVIVETIRSMLASNPTPGLPADGVIASAAPPASAYASTSLLPMNIEKKVASCAAASLRIEADVGLEAIRVKNGLKF